MKKFLSDDFLLNSQTAKELYACVKDLPIFDYHCHLSPKEIYEDKNFCNLTELWLEGDHYKWRVMRHAGIDERLVTGDGDAYDKFVAFASVLPDFAGNPVYHWAHLELKEYFGIETPLCAESAKEIWDKTSSMMADGGFSARKLICRSNVDTVITTDDPVDDLHYHKLLAKESLGFAVLPCFRPDKIINIEKPEFVGYVKALAEASSITIDGIDSLEKAICARLDYFVENGAVAADCSFENFPKGDGDRHKACVTLKSALAGEKISKDDADEYKFVVIKTLAREFAKRQMVMQIHTGVLRNQNSVRFAKIGADSGIDSVGNALDIALGGKLFDAIERDGGLPKCIVYTLNPNSYYPLATMIGDFAGDKPGKMQLGAAWWFEDHRDGIEEQLKIFADTAGIGLFNGMLTDSRSFVSYARHDYFRRVLSSVIGEWVENGEYPSDKQNLERLMKNICYFNAKKYFSTEGKI